MTGDWRNRAWLPWLVTGLVAVVVAGLWTVAIMRQREASAIDRTLRVEVLSSRPDMVTGGSARVRLSVPTTMSVSDLRVLVNNIEQPALTATGNTLEGVVTGLNVGQNTLIVRLGQATIATQLLVNHPLDGPLFAGPHERPFICQTEQFQTVVGHSLGPPVDANCTVPERSDLLYRTTGGKFKELTGPGITDPGKRPKDLAFVDGPGGAKVPYIVRVQTLTVNRGVAEVAMLYDPAAGAAQGWNRKLLYLFGEGCDAGWYIQGRRTAFVMRENLLAAGYALASNSLNVFGQNCNDLLAAETMAMTREYFIKANGMPVFTMGLGCSGGAYQAHQIADNYPGLLDGIVVGCSFADVGFDVGQLAFDSLLLRNYSDANPKALTTAQLVAISGFQSMATLRGMANAATRMNPDGLFDDDVPQAQRYDPHTNPNGARATIWDHAVNVYGRNRATGAANRPLDNQGVQYGLRAVIDGTITIEQFLDLNERIGGLDDNLRGTAERSQGVQSAVEAAYRTGRLLRGNGGLKTTPIIDYRSYTEKNDPADLHMRYHTFVVTQRLIEANGDADNQVRLTLTGNEGFRTEETVLRAAIRQMDDWLVTLKRAPQLDHRAVVESKPADLVDACWINGKKRVETQTYDGPGVCNRAYPSFSAPRLEAGQPLSGSIIACSLGPIDPNAYGRPLTPAQLDRLNRIFPDGVCDWSKPGRWSQPLQTWATFR